MWFKNSKYSKAKAVGVIAVGFLAVLLMAALVVAGADPVMDEQTGSEPAQQDADMQIVDAGGAIQSITFKKDMSIRDALRFLSLKYQKNIVPSAKVDGAITVTNLYDVTFEEALQAILGTNKYEIQDNFIRVYTLEEFQQDKTRFDHVAIPLYYVNAVEAQKLITPLLSENGQIASTAAAAVDTEPGEGGDTLAIRDQLIISDYPERIAAAKELLASIDTRPPQVLIEVTVLEAELDETTKFGIDFDSLDASVTAIGSEGTSVSGLASNVGVGITPTSKGLNVGILNDHVRVFIRALEEITDTTVLANPKILALNKQAGKLLIGNEDGYHSGSTIGEGGQTTIEQVEFLETGTKLEFRPFVCKDGMVRMELYPEQSSGEIANDLPSKTTTMVKTNIMVEDGKTIVLGGLFQEKTILSRSQVPLLGDLPVVGQLFRSVGDQSVRTELIVLITPHIIYDPQQADGAERLEDVKRLSYGARKNITWLSRARIAEDRYAKAVKYYNDGQLDAAMAEISGNLDVGRNWLDVHRLRERIIGETQPDGLESVERIMLNRLEKEESAKWFRR